NGAVMIWDNYVTSSFDRVANTPQGVPQRGDIVIWGKGAGRGYGHVAIFLEGDAKSFVSLDQNWPTLNKVTKTQHDYLHVLGWLTPKRKKNTKEQVRDAIIRAHSMTKRSDWGAQTPQISKLEADWDYNAIVIHHSGNHGSKDPKEIERKHMNDNGWDEVGYHYLVHPAGMIYEGRSILYKGSHVHLANTGKIGVLMLGDYDQQWWDFDDDVLDKSHLQKLKSLITTLKLNFPTIKYLGGHIEFAAAHGDERTCPGNILIAELDGLRKECNLNAPTQK
ncbi:MAG: hypothetical protein RL748_116, partial [Pseudomonadota bacterium]